MSAANVMPINLTASGGGTSMPLAAFLRDESTRGVLANALGSDWPAATIHAGGINEAIVHLAADPTAGILIVDFADSPDMFKALDRLAEVCKPGTLVIAIGEVNDVTLYRRLRAAGVTDYLVKPVSPEAFAHALQIASQPLTTTIGHDKAGHSKGDVVAVVGARGGVGATMVATTLAWLFAEEADRRTMLIDLDVCWGTTGLALDVETSHGLCEVLANPERIDSLFVSSAAARIGDKLSLLASEESLDTAAEARAGALELLLREARRDSERVVLDVPRLNSDLLRRALAEASVVVVVTDFSLAGLRDAGRILGLAKEMAPSAHCHVVGNRSGASKKSELPRGEIEKALKTTFTAVIPEDQTAVLQALNTGKPLPQAAPNSKAVAAIRGLASSFDQEVEKKGGLFARFFSRGDSKAAKSGDKKSRRAAG